MYNSHQASKTHDQVRSGNNANFGSQFLVPTQAVCTVNTARQWVTASTRPNTTNAACATTTTGASPSPSRTSRPLHCSRPRTRTPLTACTTNYRAPQWQSSVLTPQQPITFTSNGNVGALSEIWLAPVPYFLGKSKSGPPTHGGIGDS